MFEFVWWGELAGLKEEPFGDIEGEGLSIIHRYKLQVVIYNLVLADVHAKEYAGSHFDSLPLRLPEHLEDELCGGCYRQSGFDIHWQFGLRQRSRIIEEKWNTGGPHRRQRHRYPIQSAQASPIPKT